MDLNFWDPDFRDLDFSDLGILDLELYRPDQQCVWTIDVSFDVCKIV